MVQSRYGSLSTVSVSLLVVLTRPTLLLSGQQWVKITVQLLNDFGADKVFDDAATDLTEAGNNLVNGGAGIVDGNSVSGPACFGRKGLSVGVDRHDYKTTGES